MHRSSTSLVRVGHLRSVVASLRELGNDGEVVSQKLAKEIRLVEEHSRAGWLPLSIDLALNHAVLAQCGEQRLHQWSRKSISNTCNAPLIAPIIGGLRRLGVGATHAIRRFPGGYKLIFRNCGEMKLVHVSDEKSILHIEDAPTELRDLVYQQSFGHALAEVASIASGQPAHAEVEMNDSHLRVELLWSK